MSHMIDNRLMQDGEQKAESIDKTEHMGWIRILVGFEVKRDGGGYPIPDHGVAI